MVVIGGGFAGAAAASALTEAGVPVTLIEQRSTLGGRASSLKDGVTKEEVDNGQHFFLGSYRETRRFLRRLKVEDRLKFFPSLRIPFASAQGRRSELRCPSLPYSWGLAAGLLRHQELLFRDRWSLSRGFVSFRLRKIENLADLTVSQWLDRLRQTPGARRAFWTPLCLATLNEHPDAACAEALSSVLRQGFLGPSSDRRLGHSTVGLSKLWAMEFKAYLKRQEGVISHQQKVTGFRVSGSRVEKVLLESGEEVDVGTVICAVPLASFMKIRPEGLRDHYRELETETHSSILSIHLWFPRPFMDEPFVGLLDTNVQWVFDRHKMWENGGASPGSVTLVISGAAAFEKMTSEELVEMAMKDLRKCFPLLKDDPIHASVTWEKQATPSPSPDGWKRRPSVATPLENFFLAGDWVGPGLPATIEAACRSGHQAAKLAQAFFEKAASPQNITMTGVGTC
ncbi:MAG: FAD-dependent oxidoreductase [Elusimicrobia bacterium]|nr:FAD-dependent oxidoreductase [Elusimicrobiota bacterium]